MRTDEISFGAKPINTVIIKKFDKRAKKFVDYPATFVKLEPWNRSDIVAVDKAAENWKDSKYASKIAVAARWINQIPVEIYALTVQSKNFNRLKPGKILGLAEMRKDSSRPKEDWLYYLQVNPDAMNVNSDGKNSYKHVGSSILKSLKKIYSDMFLYSEDNPNIEKFYQNNGFIEDYILERHYHWSSNIFKRAKYHLVNAISKIGL